MGCITFSNVAYAKKWSISIEGYLSGFKVGESEVFFELNNNNYKLIANSYTTGLTKLFYDWKQQVIIKGIIKKNKIIPFSYEINDLREKNKKGHMHIEYLNNMPIIKSADPSPLNDSRRKQVNKNLLLNTLDPVTSIIQLGILSGVNNSCDHTIPIFDGRRRFNLQYKILNIEKEIITCQLKIIRIAGYSEKELKKHPKNGVIVLRNINKLNNFLFPSEVKIPLIIGSFFLNLNTKLILH